MAQYRNENGGTVVLPNGEEIANGKLAEISDDMAKTSGVSELIKDDKLVLDEDTAKPKTKKRLALEAQAAGAGVDFDGLSDEDLIAAIKAAKAS